jgi:hypothetical protein
MFPRRLSLELGSLGLLFVKRVERPRLDVEPLKRIDVLLFDVYSFVEERQVAFVDYDYRIGRRSKGQLEDLQGRGCERTLLTLVQFRLKKTTG